MADLDIRLNKIEKSCIETARKELKSLKDENDEYLNDKKLEMINDYKDELTQKYKEDIDRLNKDFNKNVFNYEVEEKKQLNEYKEKLINNIFIKVKDEMIEFVNSRGYKKFLMGNIENTIKDLNNSKCTIFVTEKDYSKYKRDIEKKFEANVDKMDESKIGGCIIVDSENKISIDNTILTNIEEQIRKIEI